MLLNWYISMGDRRKGRGALLSTLRESAVPKSTHKDGMDNTEDLWYTLINFENLEHWRQDNHWIRGSYRKTANSYVRSFASIFQFHNETINIWSHMLPAVLSLPIAAGLYSILERRYDKASKSDVLAFGCFFVGALLCLGMSATYHTISNHSPRVNRIGNKLDYVGIVLLISGSFVPSVFYGFFCDPLLQQVYWTMVKCPFFRS